MVDQLNSHSDAVKVWRLTRRVPGVGEIEEMVVTASSEAQARSLAAAAAGTELCMEWTDALWSWARVEGEPLGVRARVVQRILCVE